MRRLLVLMLCLFLLSDVPWAAPKSEMSVVSGWIRVSSEDAKGEILSVEIVVGEDKEEEPYLVTGSKERELHSLVGEWVVASGVVTEDALGWKTIDVKRYTKIDDLQKPTDPTPPAPKP